MKKSGTIFIQELESYMNENLVMRSHPIFDEIEKWAISESIPILSPVSGAILSQLVSWIRPKSILELGMGAGYSLFWMLLGIINSHSFESQSDTGRKISNGDISSVQDIEAIKILSVDRNQAFVQKVEALWKSSDFKRVQNVRFHCGWILDDIKAGLIPLDGWDLIFIDCDKVAYPEILRLILNRKQTYPNHKFNLIFDNVLWHGRILDTSSTKPSDLAMREFLAMIHNENLNFTLIPSGDGLLYVEL
ncbi:O-methyltransferase [Leptospira sp. GIMC2001]|uniref:O-methyltransferase n=1 Tax=Leptospira sp. GIMC2001 TaxID=1513297 RepID=UPI00234A1D45|nr:hypothetical protein [Leptospira sp. GIMC2001]WCL50832.1 hypothetical protein O4O04_08475 [Leptospira sp. GIMC2001]